MNKRKIADVSAAEPEGISRSVWLKKLIEYGLILIIFYFLGKTLYSNWQKISGYSWRLNYISLTLSVVILIIYTIILINGWNLILKSLGKPLSLSQASRIYLISQASRFIPGNIWSFVTRIQYSQEVGVPKIITATSMVYELAFPTVGGIIISLFFLSFMSRPKGPLQIGLLLVALVFAALLLVPKMLTRLLNFVLRLFKRSEIEMELSPLKTLSFVAYYGASYLVLGIAFFFLVNAVYLTPYSLFSYTIGAYVCACVIGFLSFITPSGLGVREGVLVYLLLAKLPTALAVAIPFLARLWQTSIEFILIITVYIFERINR